MQYIENYTNFEGVLKGHDRSVEIKYQQCSDSIGTVIAIGGTGGGFYGPSNIYDHFATQFADLKLSLLRVNVFPDHIEGAKNLLVGLDFLRQINNTKPVLLIGWSMGGASIIHIAKYIQDNNLFELKGLITLAGQSYGAEPLSQLSNVPVYIIHGTDDKCMGPRVAESLYQIANEPKQLVLLKDASHWMSEQNDELLKTVYNWIISSFMIQL
jgi:pimeloyl-ACP methyl ester carboxylesterase